MPLSLARLLPYLPFHKTVQRARRGHMESPLLKTMRISLKFRNNQKHIGSNKLTLSGTELIAVEGA